MKKQLLINVLGFLAGCVVVVGAGVAYWYWIQAEEAPQPQEKSVQERTQQARQQATSQRPQTQRQNAAQSNVVPTKLKMSRDIGGGAMYTPGQPVDVTVKLETEGSDPIRALGIEERIPPGWRFDSVIDGVRPDITPRNPESQLLEFAWFNIPEFPASFTYRLIAGPAAGAVAIDGESIFRTSGPEHRSAAVQSSLKQAGTPVSAPAHTQNPNTPTITADFALTFNEYEVPFAPGAEIPFEVALDYAGVDSVTALGVNFELPPGWSFKQVTGGQHPAVSPQEGKTDEFAFVWINTPKFPSVTQFSIKAPEVGAEPQTITGQVIYRTDGGELRSPKVEVTLQPEG